MAPRQGRPARGEYTGADQDVRAAGAGDLYDEAGDGVLLRVHVQPGARRNAVVGRHGDALKVAATAPADRGRANDAVLALLAEAFGVPNRAVTLETGAASRAKRVRIEGIDATVFRGTLGRLLGEG